MAEEEIVTQQLDYPDDKYEGGLGVDDKPPELKWAYPGRSASPELFNWLGRKVTEDLETIREYLGKYESTRKLTPLSELTQIAGKEADIIYIDNYKVAYSYPDDRNVEVGGSTNILYTEPSIALIWSMPDVSGDVTEPIISVGVDIAGEGDEIGTDTIAQTVTLDVPTASDTLYETTFDLGDISEGEDDDGWDQVRGKGVTIFVERDPGNSAVGSWCLHSVEVR